MAAAPYPREYPKRESGWTEDNGAILTNEQITGKLVGNDYVAKLRTLLDALNQPGTGEMVHPGGRVRTVQVGEVSHRLDNEEDGVVYVTFTVWVGLASAYSRRRHRYRRHPWQCGRCRPGRHRAILPG